MENQLQTIVDPLLAWYAVHRRELPWRRDKDPYHVWVSEIMLQQTRVEAVKQYYVRFIEMLPDVQSLSEVPEDRLLKLWEGLGYYTRARNLKKAAEKIVNDCGGVFPHTFASLMKLPGVGEYTAGAIASICCQEKVTAVDGNVLRVAARVTGSRENVLLPEVKKQMQAQLLKVLPDDAGTFNEAMMELGETVCLPGDAAKCGECPLRGVCTAHRDGLTSELPVRVKRMNRRQEQRTVFLLMTEDGRTAVEKRPDKGLLAGMGIASAENHLYQRGQARFYPSRLAHEGLSGESLSSGGKIPVGNARGNAGALCPSHRAQALCAIPDSAEITEIMFSAGWVVSSALVRCVCLLQ